MIAILMNYMKLVKKMSNKNENKKKKRPNGAGSFRIQRGKWNYRFTYYDIYGMRKTKSVTAETKEECLDRALAFLEKREELNENSCKDVTIADILSSKFKRDFEKNYTGEPGYRRNLYVLKSIKKHPISAIPISKITSQQMDLFLRELTSYSDSTISKIYQRVKIAFRIAKEQGIITKNLMEAEELRRPRSSKRKKKVKALTMSEQRRFEKALEEYRINYGANDYRLQLLIELYSGMRMGEINALRPEDIDFDHMLIHVNSTISVDVEGNSKIKDGAKTEKGKRSVPICKTLEGYLLQALENMRDNPYGLIFYNHKTNSLVTTSDVNNLYNRILNKAGIPRRGQHSLRHTFATRCIEAEVPAVVLKEWLGHTDIHITLDTYAEVFSSLNNDSINKYESYLNKLHS